VTMKTRMKQTHWVGAGAINYLQYGLPISVHAAVAMLSKRAGNSIG
jgi:hypothetical protein